MKDETALQDLPVVETSAEEIRGGVINPAERAPPLRPPPP